MQTLIQIVSTGTESLREKIINDKKLKDFYLRVAEQKRSGRSKGWAKLHSTDGAEGAINLEWYKPGRLLLCRVVNKRGGRPNLITGDFIDYLLARHSKSVQSIQIVPR